MGGSHRSAEGHYRSIAVILAVTLVFGVVGASPAAAAATDYYLIDGSAAGTGLSASGNGSVQPAHNKSTQATGHVEAANPPNCDEPHYVGTLRGKPDPDPTGCGWGRLIKKVDGSDRVRSVAKAIEFELSAAKNHDAGKFSDSLDDLTKATGTLFGLRAILDGLALGSLVTDAENEIGLVIDSGTGDDSRAAAQDSSSGDPVQFAQAIADGLEHKAAVVVFLGEAHLTLASEAPPEMSNIIATFFATKGGHECPKKHSGVCETRYKGTAQSGSHQAKMSSSWLLVPPALDTGCTSFDGKDGDGKQSAIWHHANVPNTDGCHHEVQGPDGHEGSVTLFARGGKFACAAEFVGTVTIDDSPTQGPDQHCFYGTGKLLAVQTARGAGESNYGSGKVTSQPDGIDCSTACATSALYPDLTPVTLTEAPDPGSTFVGWSGGGCTGTATTCSVTMDEDKSVLATFSNE